MKQRGTPFDSIKHTTEYGADFWMARELMSLLGYDTWRRFEESIERAQESCRNAGYKAEEEFLPAPAKIPLPPYIRHFYKILALFL